MSKNYASICIDREKVYGILNEENMSISDLAKDIGVTYSAVKTWLNNGKVSEEFFDILVFSLGEDPLEIKGKSSLDVGPNQTKYIENHSRTSNRKSWSEIDSMKFESLIKKNFGNISQFASHVRMSDVSIHHYISWGKIPSQYIERFASALDVDPSEFVVGESVIDILEERDGKIEKVKNLVEAGSTFKEAAEEAAIESVQIRPVDSSEVDVLRARIEELEKRLAKYEKPEYLSKHGYDNREMHHRVDSTMSVYFKEEGFTKNQIMDSVCGVEDLVIRLTDVACKNYVVSPEGKRLGFNRNRFVEVPDPSKYYQFYNDICSRFIEEFVNSRSMN